MSTIELFVKNDCIEPCKLAREYIENAINELESLGIPTDYNELNIDTNEGRKRYEIYEKLCKEKNMEDLPLIVIDGSPFYVGAGKSLPFRIISKVRGKIDSKY